jgi:cytochrome P450
VAYSDFLGWSIFRHADVVRVLHDPATFSNVVSSRRAVPSGMDPPEHTEYRRLIEPYFEQPRIDAFEPQCRDIARRLVQSIVGREEVECSSQFAQPFAVQVQCAFLGWPPHMHEPLDHWTLKSHGATFAQDRVALEAIAREFEGYVDELLQARRDAGDQASDDITTSLMRQQIQGRPLNQEELVSILRNWTAGEVGTISAAVGIVAHFLAEHGDVQQQLRADPSRLSDAVDEILRIHGPLVANRRVTTRSVEIGGRQIAAGERISINWIAANRDPRVFPDPDTFRLDRDPAANLLYGAGIHVCPGAQLARMELRVVTEELLSGTQRIEAVPNKTPLRAHYPASGFKTLPLRVRCWDCVPLADALAASQWDGRVGIATRVRAERLAFGLRRQGGTGLLGSRGVRRPPQLAGHFQP